MTNKTEIKVESSWDKDVVPANEPRKRGLLVEIIGIAEKRVDRRPVNLCLVIDRSGSMGGEKINQVRNAALQILAGLENGETFNIIAYNDGIDRLSSAPLMKNRRNR